MFAGGRKKKFVNQPINQTKAKIDILARKNNNICSSFEQD